jgi:hypothetical protein
MKRIVGFISGLIFSGFVLAQTSSADSIPLLHNSQACPPGPEQKDIIDIYHHVFPGKKKAVADTIEQKKLLEKSGKLHTSFLPGVGYALATKFAVAAAANGAFYTDNAEDANLSVVNALFVYSQLKQLTIPIQSIIWTKGNKYNFQGDWRYYQYPQYTYGLGGHTSLENADLINYSFVTIHQTVAKHIKGDLYAGVGYDLDYHWNITESGNEDGSITDYQRYGGTNKSVSSGASLHLLYDGRRNAINPPEGFYANIVYRDNLSQLGSDRNWQSLLMDIRKYYKFPACSNNVLAFWSYTWLTLGGTPPYLDLPSTAWDTYSNMGRGYIQSRFRGDNLLYLESEYRFNMTKNGLFGGVVFVNAQSVSEWPSNKFEVISPAAGLGLRMKVNKHSNTNIALDYGWGLGGSNGLFINLGEVF